MTRPMASAKAHAESARLVAVVGPTGTGKSELSLNLAEALAKRGIRAEIVNADAMQLYRGMDIGTAKLPPEQWRGIPHHQFDVLNVTDEATAARYQPGARSAIAEIHKRGATAILVGGSGLYVSSVIYDFAFPGTDPSVRAQLEADALEFGPGELYRRLKLSDPAAAATIGTSNVRRLVRALEVITLTGQPYGASLPEVPVPWMPVRILGLRAPREELVVRLDRRVERMWGDGLVAEAESLLGVGLEQGVTASRAIGYAQAIGQLRGRLSEAEAVTETQLLTRRYARRQMSWFKRYPSLNWLDYDSANLVDQALDRL